MASTDNRIDDAERMVGATHPTLADTLNRHGTAFHDITGMHLWKGGSSVASASSISVPDDENYFVVTGTTTINGIAATFSGADAVSTGFVAWIKFTGTLTLTHNATSFIMPQGQNLSISAGDYVIVRHAGSGNWEVLSYSGAATTAQAYRRRLNINGDGAIMQGSAYDLSGAAASTYGYGPDMWEAAWSGTTCTAGSFTTTASAPNGRTGNAAHLSGVTLTGTGVLYARTKIESKDAKHLKNAAAIFSVSVQHDVGSAINVTASVYKANAADNFVATTLIQAGTPVSVSSGTATEVTVSVADMGDCSNGIMILLTIEAGAVTTKNVYVTEAQIEEGTVTTPYEWRSHAEELAKCLRYYEVHGGTAGTTQLQQYAGASEAHVFQMPFMVEKRVTPTMTKNGTWNVTNCGQPSVGNASPKSYGLTVTTSGAGVFGVYADSTDDTITADARL